MPDEINDHLTISIGHVVKKDKKYIYLSNYFDGIAENWEDPWTSIPVHMIEKRKELCWV
jgi:hypothetical protein